MIKEIKFTDKAIKEINNLLLNKDKGSFFRIAIKGGGCSGFQYDFSIDNTMKNKAREMIILTRQINDFLSKIDDKEEKETEKITCWTCHKGSFGVEHSR